MFSQAILSQRPQAGAIQQYPLHNMAPSSLSSLVPLAVIFICCQKEDYNVWYTELNKEDLDDRVRRP